MFANLFRRKKSVTPKACPYFRPTLEVLEDRLAPATFTWVGGAAGNARDWQTPANWTGGAPGTIPTLVDDVVLKSTTDGLNDPILNDANANTTDVKSITEDPAWYSFDTLTLRTQLALD